MWIRKAGMTDFPKRGDIYWVNLDPTIGSEISKQRPCLVVSNNAGNEVSLRIIVAPITSAAQQIYPFEVPVELSGKKCKILLDQVRTVDKSRLSNKIHGLESKVMVLVDKALKIALALS